MSAPAGVHDLHRPAGITERGVDNQMDTQQTVDALEEVLRRAQYADGPNGAEYLLATIADDVARAVREDPYGLADRLAELHRYQGERIASWDERLAAFQAERTPAIAEAKAIQGHIEGILQELALAHRRRTREATLTLPRGSKVTTRESTAIDVRISDAAAFMAAVRDREDLPEGVIDTPDPVLRLLAARAYAKAVLLGNNGVGAYYAGELLPGVEVIPAGQLSSSVAHAKEATL